MSSGDNVIKDANEHHIERGTATVTEDSYLDITFAGGRVFTNTPSIALAIVSNAPEHIATIYSVTTSSFRIYLSKPGGGQADDLDIHWIATDNG